MQKEIINDGLSYKEKLECIAKRFGTARKCTVRRDIPGSTAFVPSVVGLIVAGEVIKDLAKK